MSRKRQTPEQIIGKLREAEVSLSGGQTVPEVCRSLSVSEQTYYRRRKEYGGLHAHATFRKLKHLPAPSGTGAPILCRAARRFKRAWRSWGEIARIFARMARQQR